MRCRSPICRRCDGRHVEPRARRPRLPFSAKESVITSIDSALTRQYDASHGLTCRQVLRYRPPMAQETVRRKRLVTVADVAAAAQVSTATAARALGGYGSVSAAAMERVLAAASRL